MRVLAIDQGTSATKALLLDDDVVIGECAVQCAPSPTADGGVEVDPEVLWRSVIEAGRGVLAETGVTTIDAIGLANQGETVLAWDRATSRPVSAAVIWQDRRSGDVCERLRAEGWDEPLASITGLALDPYFVAPKITWLRDRVESSATITTTDVWLLHRLCGAFVTDVATASRTLLLDLDAVSWSSEAAAAFSIDLAECPQIVANAGPVGETTAFTDAAAPITGLCVDQQAALFAESCTEWGEAKCTYGTGAFLLASTGHSPKRSSTGLVGCVAWRVGDDTTWCLDGQVYTVGAAVTWLQQLGIIDSPSAIDAMAGEVDDTGGVTFIPCLAGLGAPLWEPDARGSLTGLSLGTTGSHVVRAMVEGIAAQVAWLARAAGDDLGAPLTRLRVDGGLTRSEVLMQIQADLLQVPIEVYPSPNATAMGVAAFAAMGAGGSTAANRWTPSRIHEPRIGADEADERLARWKHVAESTMRLTGR